MKKLQRIILITFCIFLFLFPLTTASACLVQQPLYADGYYDSFQPDRESLSRRDSLDNFDIDELEDEVAKRKNQQNKTEKSEQNSVPGIVYIACAIFLLFLYVILPLILT